MLKTVKIGLDAFAHLPYALPAPPDRPYYRQCSARAAGNEAVTGDGNVPVPSIHRPRHSAKPTRSANFTPVELLNPEYLPTYRAQQRVPLTKALADLTEARKTGSKAGADSGASDLMRVYESAVYSSQIEGSKVTLNIFKATMEAAGNKPKPRDVQEVYDLVLAYQFARDQALNTKNLLEAHRILSSLLVTGNDQGAWRTKGVKVGNAFTTVYMAAHQSMVPRLMDGLMSEVDLLLQRKLRTSEVFYYAALLHLAFVKIHPFIDGNGRTGRLLEKWFLAHHLGPVAWSVPSERFYIRNLDEYYETLAAMGPDRGALQWDRCIPFLLLLPRSLRNK